MAHQYLVGATLGIAGGLTTKVRLGGYRRASVQSTVWAAGLWVIGIGARIGFVLWSEHGGATHIDHFSVAHDITGSSAWTAALVLMALSEVLVRLTTIVVRGRRMAGGGAAPTADGVSADAATPAAMSHSAA